MKILILENTESAAKLATRAILEALKEKPDLVLGLATGSTPIGIYAGLVSAHQSSAVDFSRVSTFNLDEYLDLPAEHEQSFYYFMRKHLFDGVNIPPDRIHFPPTVGPQLLKQCVDYETLIREAGGIDLQILGIGSNGHIGFNEPTSSLASRTRLKTLTDKTLRDNSRFYGPNEQPPEVASTMGIGTILDTRRILLQAFGSNKAEAIRQAVEGPVSAMCPGSALQLHQDVTFLLDDASAARLSMVEYYKRAQVLDASLREQL